MTNSNLSISPLEQLIQQSKFIFKGTLQQLRSATMKAVPINDSTTIVKVDEVLQAPKTLGNYTGKNITVQLTDVQDIKEGQQAIFFTNSWLYGESLAVLEVGRRSLEKTTVTVSSISTQIGNIKKNLAEEALQKRIERCDLIVTGKVLDILPVGSQEEKTSAFSDLKQRRLREQGERRNTEIDYGRLLGDLGLINTIATTRLLLENKSWIARILSSWIARILFSRKSLAVSNQRQPLSEHDPQWTKALIDIKMIEKGQLSQPKLTVMFPDSMDVMWYKVPKFKKNQEGLWLLERRQIQEIGKKAYTAIDPLDFQPLNEPNYIRELIQRLKEPKNS
ncbi:MAG: hypothetical protein AB4038_21130 [Prochloraceae cyanobacterium]